MTPTRALICSAAIGLSVASSVAVIICSIALVYFRTQMPPWAFVLWGLWAADAASDLRHLAVRQGDTRGAPVTRLALWLTGIVALLIVYVLAVNMGAGQG